MEKMSRIEVLQVLCSILQIGGFFIIVLILICNSDPKPYLAILIALPGFAAVVKYFIARKYLTLNFIVALAGIGIIIYALQL